MHINQSLPPQLNDHVSRWSLVIVMAWLGAMGLTPDGAASLAQWFAQHAIIGRLVVADGGIVIAHLAGGTMVGTALLLAAGAWFKPIRNIGTIIALVILTVPITTLFTNPVWIESLGGFPAIGSGQGIIKYPALAGIAFYMYADTARPRLRPAAHSILVAAVMLPLIWIGLMKFTAVEAAGIEPLLASSPLMSWMPGAFGNQGASNLIGAAELITVGLLASWWYKPAMYPVAAILTTATFLTTLSFLLSLPGWDPETGFPALSGAGVFIIKDLGLLVAAILPLSARSGDP